MIGRRLVGFSMFVVLSLLCIGDAAALSDALIFSFDTASQPITEAQLAAYFEESSLLPATKQQLQERLELIHRQVPPWMPNDVWLDFRHRVGAVDVVRSSLPVYQKYFSETDGAALLLMYDGPTGHDLGMAIHPPKPVAGVAQQVVNAKVAGLRQKRLSELTVDQRGMIQQLQQKMASRPGSALRMDNEQDLALQRRLDDLWTATLIAHHTELAAAQSRYKSKH